MLPPVSTASNAYPAYQDARVPSDSAGATAALGANAAAKTPGALEQNNEIAGRLNLLLLTGQERMAQNLTVLVDLLGSALKMERLPNEPLSGYAARLIEALTDLTPRERVALQRQLMQAFAGLQLRTLIEAFRNPVGPEAATLSIYLELYRQKDRDLATRSVVTSYRQNSAEGRVPLDVLPKSSGSEATTAPRTPPGVSLSDSGTHAAGSIAVDKRPAGPSVETRNFAQLGTATRAPEEMVEISRQPPPVITAAEDLQTVRNQLRNLEIVPHVLQAQLDETFAGAKMISAVNEGQIAVPPEQAARDLPWADANDEQGNATRLQTAFRQATSAQEAGLSGTDPIEPNANMSRSPLVITSAGANGQPPAMFPPIPATSLIDVVETDLARVLLNLQVEEASRDGAATDIVQIHGEAEDLAPARSDRGLAPFAPEPEALTLALAQRGRSGGFEEQVAYAMFTAPTDAPVALQAIGLRDVIPVPFVNYLIVDAFDPDLGEVEERRHAEDEEEPGDEGLSDDGAASDDPNEQAQEQVHEDHAGQEANLLTLQETAPVFILEDLSADRIVSEPAGQDDPAHDLYLRMSGLI